MPSKQSYMKTHNLERELTLPVIEHLKTIGCTVVIPELRFFDRGIDVYGICEKRPHLTYAVELKLSNWQRAIQQASVYQLCAHFSYIAMPIQNALNLDISPFKAFGLGILMVRRDSSVGVLLEAKRSTELRKDYVHILRHNAMETVNAKL